MHGEGDQILALAMAIGFAFGVVLTAAVLLPWGFRLRDREAKRWREGISKGLERRSKNV